jgi:putative ATPase
MNFIISESKWYQKDMIIRFKVLQYKKVTIMYIYFLYIHMHPYAEQLRPKNIDEYIGQTHLVWVNKPLRKAIESKMIFSFILWGPPWSGKTTLARIYAQAIGADFYELSAVSAGKDDIKKIISGGNLMQKVLFLDEIHRFNKSQQDFLLPYVESWDLILIGATTENPSFEVIPALLSRLRVFTLQELTKEDMQHIITRTKLDIDEDTIAMIIELANGDARQLLTLLDNTFQLYGSITKDTIKNTMQSKFLRYDKKWDEHYNTISAFIKSMRASQPNAAVYYLARMLDAWEDPKFIARRMIIFASEDIGIAQSTALVVANEVFRSVEIIGMPECAINLSHGVVYLANCPKDRRSYDAIFSAKADVEKFWNLPIPMALRNAKSKLMKENGYGSWYEMYTDKDYLPEKLRGKKYWKGR